MSWARFDDRYHDNRKIKRAWRRHPRAVGLHAMAVTYCSMHDTDGWIDEEWLEDKLPAKGEREKCLAALAEVGLFEPSENGDYRVHDFLEYNHSKDEKDALREQKADRQRKWRETQRSKARDASRDAAPTRPDPTRPVPPYPPRGKRGRDRERFDKQLRSFRDEHFPGVPVEHVAWCAANLRSQGIEPTVDELRPVVEQFYPVEAPTT